MVSTTRRGGDRSAAGRRATRVREVVDPAAQHVAVRDPRGTPMVRWRLWRGPVCASWRVPAGTYSTSPAVSSTSPDPSTHQCLQPDSCTANTSWRSRCRPNPARVRRREVGVDLHGVAELRFERVGAATTSGCQTRWSPWSTIVAPSAKPRWTATGSITSSSCAPAIRAPTTYSRSGIVRSHAPAGRTAPAPSCRAELRSPACRARGEVAGVEIAPVAPWGTAPHGRERLGVAHQREPHRRCTV